MDSLFEKVRNYLVAKGAKRVEVFGSRARKEFRKNSDLDIIVAFKDTPSLMTLVRFEKELSKLTGVKIDLLTEKSISPLILDRIKSDRIVLY